MDRKIDSRQVLQWNDLGTASVETKGRLPPYLPEMHPTMPHQPIPPGAHDFTRRYDDLPDDQPLEEGLDD